MKLLKNGIKLNEMGKELLIGNFVYYSIGEILVLFMAQSKLYVSLGFTLGFLISVFMVIHMTVALEQAMCFNEKGADCHIRKTTAVRLLISLAALILIGVTDIGNIVAALFGIMALKVSAYLQPFTHKVLAKKSTEKGR